MVIRMGRYRIPMADWVTDSSAAFAKYIPAGETADYWIICPDIVEVYTIPLSPSPSSLPPTVPSDTSLPPKEATKKKKVSRRP